MFEAAADGHCCNFKASGSACSGSWQTSLWMTLMRTILNEDEDDDDEEDDSGNHDHDDNGHAQEYDDGDNVNDRYDDTNVSVYLYNIHFRILPNLALDDLDDYDNDGDEDVDHSFNDDNNYDFDGKEDEDNDDSGDYDDASRLCIFFQTFALDNCSVFLQYKY